MPTQNPLSGSLAQVSLTLTRCSYMLLVSFMVDITQHTIFEGDVIKKDLMRHRVVRWLVDLWSKLVGAVLNRLH